MSSELVLPLIMRWTHVICAIIVVGGLFYTRFVVAPALRSTLSDEDRARLHETLMNKWKPLLAMCMLLFLASGFYSYLFVTRFDHVEQPLYHALFGIKLLLAMLLFALAFVVSSTMDWSDKLRENRLMWTLVVLVMFVVVLIAGFLRTMPISV